MPALQTMHLFSARLIEDEVNELQKCIEALQNLGLSVEEAANVVETCDSNMDRIRELYCIDWGP